MRSNRDWQAIVKGIIRAELARRNIGYRELAERLEAIGVKGMNERPSLNKVNRGTFSGFPCAMHGGEWGANDHLDGSD
jgi:hypothetical protein